MGTIKVSDDHTVQSWSDLHGRPIFHPLFKNSEYKNRGGLFCAVPVFGPVPDTPIWTEVDIPQHGMLRELTTGDWAISHKSIPDEEKSSFRASLGGRYGYPWQFAVEVCHTYIASAEILTTQIIVSRSTECTTKSLMPLSLGTHPYFATHGKPARIWHDDQPIEVDLGLKQPRYLEVANSGTKLETEYGFIDLNIHSNIEGFLLWTDSPQQYVCLEPVSGFKSPHVLTPGDTHFYLSQLRYKSK